MLRLLADENFNQDILRGPRRRLPSLDCVIAQQTELQGAKDPALLDWAAAQQRILLTHDLKTIPKYAYERIAAGLPMPGILALASDLPIGQAIKELVLVIECSEQDEFDNRVTHLPL